MNDLQRSALAFRLAHGSGRLREVLAPYCRPGSKLDLRLITDQRGALVALALAQAEETDLAAD